MGFVRDHQRALKTVFVAAMLLLRFGLMGFAQPILFIIGYVDAALLLFFAWLLYAFVKSLISPL